MSVSDCPNQISEDLQTIANPDIYRINAFRILQIPVTATLREANNQMRKLTLQEKLGNNGHLDNVLLPLIPIPDADARREAYQRLENPESRLIDELFWFWPLTLGLSDSNDEALEAMQHNDYSEAIAIWKQHETNASESNISMHNLAIMYHVLALDFEQMRSNKSLTKKQSDQKREYWEQAFFRWKILLNHDGLWSRLSNRVRELDDPRLTTGVCRRLQDGLPIILLTINAKLAIRASLQNDKNEANYHMEIIKKSGFNEGVIEESLRQAVAAIRDRIKVLCTNSEADAKINPGQGDTIIQSLVAQSNPMLTTLDTVLPKRHSILDSAHDAVASAILQIAILFSNKTKDWNKTLPLTASAMTIASSDSLHKRLEINLDVNKDNILHNTCWFCNKNPSDEKAVAVVKMHGGVKQVGTRIQWRNLNINVPRCKECKVVHDKLLQQGKLQKTYGCLGIVAGVILAIILGASVQSGWAAFIALVVCGIAGFVIPALTKTKLTSAKNEEFKIAFPDVKKQETLGWVVGEKPPGVR